MRTTSNHDLSRMRFAHGGPGAQTRRQLLWGVVAIAAALVAGCPSKTGAQSRPRMAVTSATGGHLLTAMQSGHPASTVAQVLTPPRIDGQLGDWSSGRFAPLAYLPLTARPSRGARLSVKVAFRFDLKHLYVAVQAHDGSPHVPHRAWRHGDGFMLTLGEPSNRSSTSRFVTLGFSGATRKQSRVVVVNRNGRFFPTEPTTDIAFAHRFDKKAGLVTYEAAIPWRHLDPFRPLTHGRWGINVIYTDNRGQGRRRRRLLVPDHYADTEATPWRRVRTFHFAPARRRHTQCQVSVRRRFVLFATPVPLTLGCTFAAAAGPGAIYRVETQLRARGRVLARHQRRLPSAPAAWRIAEWSVTTPRTVSTGEHDMVVLLRRGARVVHRATRRVFVVGGDGLAPFMALQKLSRSPKAKHPLLPSLAIRLKWLLRFLYDQAPSANPAPLKKVLREGQMLVRLFRSTSPTFTKRGARFRFAHQSAIDGSLQPYSVYIPPKYDPRRPPPLLVVLHGSGVDEQRTLSSAIKRYGHTGWLILAPKARELSSWYLGPAGQDVVEAIGHLHGLLPYQRNRVYLQGFSMGGYGAWSIGLRHPKLFRAVAVLSGGVSPRGSSLRTGPHVMQLLKQSKQPLPAFLVVHGKRDLSIPVGPVRRLVTQLQARRIAHRYIELPKAAHGNYNAAKQVLSWFRQHRR